MLLLSDIINYMEKLNKLKNFYNKYVGINLKELIFLIIFICFCFYDTGYMIYKPGGIVNVDTRITGNNLYESSGTFNMAYVSAIKGKAPIYLIAKLMPNWELVKNSDVIIDNETMEDVEIQDRLDYQKAIVDAKYVALKKAGVDFNLDKECTDSFGIDNKTFPNCLSYEVTANSDITAGAFNKWTSDNELTEQEYYARDFEIRYPKEREENDDHAELIRLVNWVSDATDEEFKNNLEQYFNKEYLFKYFLNVMVFGQVDNLGKNMMLTTWDGNIWYPQFYDLDF